MPATDAQPRPCAIADAMEVIGERWSLLIVREQFWGNHRFSDIQRATGAPRDILATRLRRLDQLRNAAKGKDNLLPYIKDALRDRASLGEVCGAMQDVFGKYAPTF